MSSVARDNGRLVDRIRKAVGGGGDEGADDGDAERGAELLSHGSTRPLDRCGYANMPSRRRRKPITRAEDTRSRRRAHNTALTTPRSRHRAHDTALTTPHDATA